MEYTPKDTSIIQLQSVINFCSVLGYNYFAPTRSFGSGWYVNKGREWISLQTAINLHNGNYHDWHGLRFRDPFSNIPQDIYKAAQKAKIVVVAKLQHSRKKGIVTQDHRVTFVIPENAEVLLKK